MLMLAGGFIYLNDHDAPLRCQARRMTSWDRHSAVGMYAGAPLGLQGLWRLPATHSHQEGQALCSLSCRSSLLHSAGACALTAPRNFLLTTLKVRSVCTYTWVCLQDVTRS